MLASAVALAIFAFKGQGDILADAFFPVVLGWVVLWLSALTILAKYTPRKPTTTPTRINVAGASS